MILRKNRLKVSNSGGMVLAIDGSVTTETFRAQIGDSFILTEDGYEAITSHPKSLEDVIIH